MWSVVPSGGWKFPVKDGPPLEGTDHNNLVQVITAYRNDNGIPVGDPESDLDNYICGAFPHLCNAGQGGVNISLDEDAPQLSYGKPIEPKIADRIYRWAHNRISRFGSINYVDKDEAERRSGICIKCPSNDKTWARKTVDNCPGCKTKVDALNVNLYKLRQGKSVTRESSLGACLSTGQENQVAVWLQESALRHRHHYPLPPNCWMNGLKADAADSST